MSEESDESDPESFARFRRLAKRVGSLPKAEIDKRAEEWRAARESDKREKSDE